MSKYKGEVIEAHFTVLEDDGPRSWRSFNPVFVTGLIVGIIFLFTLGVQIGREADRMPQTEEEILLQQYEQALATEVEAEPIPPKELLPLHPSREEQKRKRAQEVLEKLDQLWSKY